jgi:hypothetical protein
MKKEEEKKRKKTGFASNIFLIIYTSGYRFQLYKHMKG